MEVKTVSDSSPELSTKIDTEVSSVAFHSVHQVYASNVRQTAVTHTQRTVQVVGSAMSQQQQYIITKKKDNINSASDSDRVTSL